jgi:hypothetical protein
MYRLHLFTVAGLLSFANLLQAQTTLPIYTDGVLLNGFQDWSWSSTRNFQNVSPVEAGTYSIAVTVTTGWGGFRVYNPVNLDSTAYNQLSFWMNGGAAGMQLFQVFATSGMNIINHAVRLDPVPADTWVHISIPLSTLGVTGESLPNGFNGFIIQEITGGPQPTIYLDEISLTSVPEPTVVVLIPAALFTCGALWRKKRLV